MEISRTIARDGNILPRSHDVVRRVPEQAWRHLSQGVLHPRTAHARSLDKVVAAWSAVFPALAKLSAQIRFDLSPAETVPLEAAYRGLLYALNEHVDACYAVMRCLAEPNGKVGLFHDQVARSLRLPGLKTFDEQVIGGYRKVRLGAAVNLLKHNESRLRLLAFRSSGLVTLGYFVDGPLPGGAIGPALSVHADGNSAFSFSRDMLIHWWWLYRGSELMANVIESSLATHGSRLAPRDASGGASETPEAWVSLCRDIAALPPDFMPDEVDQHYPLVTVSKSADAMRIRYPAGRRANICDPAARITGFMGIDAVGQPYKLPYLGAGVDAVAVEAASSRAARA